MIFNLKRSLVTLLIFSNFVLIFTKPNRALVVKVKSALCENLDPTIYNGTVKCWIKPTRDGNGITNVRYFYGKPASDLWLQLKVFYKFFTGTQFRPWMIDLDVDVCKHAPQISQLNGFIILFAKSLIKNAPELIHPCPYTGEEGLKNADINAIIGDTVPQVIPKGMYKMLLRFHLKNNQTFLNVWLTAHVDANEPLKGFEMGK